MTYQPKIYRAQGADTLVITTSGVLELAGTLGTSGSSAVINMETGGTLNVKSGATLAIASGSSCTCATPIEFASGGYTKMPFASKTKLTKGTAIVAGSVNTITASSTNSECDLPAPVQGAMIYAVCISRVSPGVYTLSSTVDFTGTATNKLAFGAAAQRALLFGTSAAWAIGYATAVTTS